MLGPLTFCDGPHSVCGVCFSLNKTTFSYHFVPKFFRHEARTLIHWEHLNGQAFKAEVQR